MIADFEGQDTDIRAYSRRVVVGICHVHFLPIAEVSRLTLKSQDDETLENLEASDFS